MRIGELSRVSGVPVATVKHYLREGLLPRGEATSRTQAEYDQRHVHRLRLVRALTDVGGLSLAAARAVLDAVDAPGTSLNDALGTVSEALPPTAPDDVDTTDALRAVERAGWRVWPSSAALRQLAVAMRAMADVGLDASVELVAQRARLMGPLVDAEVADVPSGSTAEAVEFVALGTVLHEPLLLALRRLGHQDAAVRRFS